VTTVVSIGQHNEHVSARPIYRTEKITFEFTEEAKNITLWVSKLRSRVIFQYYLRTVLESGRLHENLQQ